MKATLDLANLPEQVPMFVSGSSQLAIHHALSFTIEEGFDLVDTAEGAILGDRRGAPRADVFPLLQRLGMNAEHRLNRVKYSNRYCGSCGRVPHIWIVGLHRLHVSGDIYLSRYKIKWIQKISTDKIKWMSLARFG